jgi:hypothetical protein
VKGWLSNLEGDVRYGGTRTLPGRVLHAMGAQGINIGAQAGAGDTLASPVLGPIHAAQGVAETPEHPVRGPLKALGGVLETATLPASFMAPEAAETSAAIPGMVASKVTGRAAKSAGGELFNTVAKAASDANLTVNTGEAIEAAQKITENAARAGRNVLGIRKFVQRVSDAEKGPLTYEEARGFYQNIRNLSVSDQNALNPATKRLVDNFLSKLDSGIRTAADSIGQGDNYSKAMELYRKGAQQAEFYEKKLVPYMKKLAVGAAIGVGARGGYDLYDLISSK